MTPEQAVKELDNLKHGIDSIRSAISELGEALRPVPFTTRIYSVGPVLTRAAIVETIHNPGSASITFSLGWNDTVSFATTLAAGATITSLGLYMRSETWCLSTNGSLTVTGRYL